jgi:CubicO group peptidase (beta-lactamase class C family)
MPRMSRRPLLAVLVILSLAGWAAAPRGLDQAAPTITGVDLDRLKRLDTMFQQHVDEHRISGAVARVLRDGIPVYERAFGWSDREAGRPMSMDALFRIASQTKALTSVAILMLMEEGKLSLSSPASLFIPAFAKTTVVDGATTVPARRPITIRDLLTHTAGISYGTEASIASQYEAKGLGPAAGYGWYTADKDEGTCETMERLASLPFRAQPGESYVYGYNTDVLGCIVERVSGMPLDEFITSRITRPLGMTDTWFFLPSDERPRLATVYASAPDDRIARAPDTARGQGHYVEGPRRNFSGGAGLVSTARDYARFLEMIRRGGELEGERLLSPRSVALMTTNQIGTLRGPAVGFGLGFETTEQYGGSGMSSVGSFGWGGAYGSTYRVDPEARLVMVMMVQLLPNRTELRDRFYALVYQALTDPPGRATGAARP